MTALLPMALAAVAATTLLPATMWAETADNTAKTVRLVSGGWDDNVILWDLTTGKQRWSWER